MEPQSQIESEISSQEDGEKRERIPKKLWHGKRQIYEKLQGEFKIVCKSLLRFVVKARKKPEGYYCAIQNS